MPQTLETLSTKAARVVLARVSNQYAGWDEAHRRIYTWTELEVLETWKGPDQSSVLVKSLGGQVGDVGMRVSGTPEFVPGERVVVFLREVGAEFAVVGMSQGKFRVVDDVAISDARGLAYPAGAEEPVQPDLPSLPLSELRQRVHRAAADESLDEGDSGPADSTPSPPPLGSPGRAGSPLPETPAPQTGP